MGDALLRVATGVSPVADADRSPEPHAPYTSPTTEYIPPTSPQPQMPYAAKRGFGLHRSKQPAQLQMDTADAPPYEHPVYSPSPADSPSLPLAALPSPKFAQRQRAPSLLRHAAIPSSLNDIQAGMGQGPMSPIMAHTMARPDSGPRSPDWAVVGLFQRGFAWVTCLTFQTPRDDWLFAAVLPTNSSLKISDICSRLRPIWRHRAR